MNDVAVNTTTKEKEFGQVMALALFLLSIPLCYKENSWWFLFVGIGLVFLVLAYICPLVLKPIEKVWMLFAKVLSLIMTSIILTLTFFFAVTPMGFLVRLMGKDLLSLKLDKSKTSYWEDVDSEPGSRPYAPY